MATIALATPSDSLLNASYRQENSVDINSTLTLSIQSIQRQEMIQRVNQHKIAKDHDITGLKLWDFGLQFAKYLAAKPHFFANKNIMELGAGCGTLSLTLAASANEASSITVTDAAMESLELIAANIKQNQAKLIVPIQVQRCWWTVEEPEKTEEPEEPEKTDERPLADVVLGTDLLYHLTTVESLFATAARAMKKECGVFFLGGMSRFYGTIESIRTAATNLGLSLHFISLQKMTIPEREDDDTSCWYCDGMFLCVIAHNEQCFAPVLKALDLHIDDSVNDDFEEDY